MGQPETRSSTTLPKILKRTGPMDRTERFYKIELLLKSRGCVSFAALIEALQVSPATLKRDLRYLRDRMDAPIVYSAFDNGYRFGAGSAGLAAGARHELPGLWFSENEIHALLSMHQLLSGLDEDGVLARHLQPLLEKLQSMAGTDAVQARELMKRIKVIGTARRRSPSRWFESLGGALMRRQRIALRYFKRSDGSQSEREISPQRLVHYRGTWYLDAWCHASDGLRRFALDAIRNAAPLPSKAKIVALRDLEAELDAGYGIYGGPGSKLRWAHLVFDAEAARWVASEEWHPQQKSRWLDDGRFELHVPFTDARELAMDVLRHGDSVQVVGDKALVTLIDKRLRAAAARYA